MQHDHDHYHMVIILSNAQMKYDLDNLSFCAPVFRSGLLTSVRPCCFQLVILLLIIRAKKNFQEKCEL